MKQQCVKLCQLCRKKGPEWFVYDEQTADLICTNCGCVQQKFFAQSIYGNIQSYHNPVHTVVSVPIDSHPQAKYTETVKLKKQAELDRRMLERWDPEGTAEFKLTRAIEEYGEYLDYNQKIMTRCEHFFIKSKVLQKRRPRSLTVIATLIVAKRQCGDYVNITEISNFVGVGDLGAHVIAVCKILRISHRSRIDKMIPGFVSALGFPYKYNKVLQRLYNKFNRENGAMASNTIMALVLYRFYMTNKTKAKPKVKKVDIEFIAEITGSSVTTLSSYLHNGKCTVFPKTR